MQSMDFFSSEINPKQKFISELQNDGYIVLNDESDGARLKLWVQKEDKKYLAKQDKIFPSGEYTNESLSEFLAYKIAKCIDVPCVNIILGNHYVLSQVMTNYDLQSFVEFSEELAHSFHMSNLTTFDISTLLDRSNNKYYSDVYQMLLFDALIGNSDRHPGNFMYNEVEGFYPLFDNGSSLCSYIEDNKIESFLKDSCRWNSLVYTKSKPVLRADQKLTHKELVTILKRLDNCEFSKFATALQHLNVSDVVNSLNISELRKTLLTRFIEERKTWFNEENSYE